MTLASAVTMPFFGEALEVDGQLNEQEWQSAISLALDKTVSPFTLASIDTPPQVKVLSTVDGLYVGVSITREKSQQTSVRTSRDADLESDFVRLIIDFDNAKTNAYSFVLGNGGSMQDGIWRDENQFVKDWDGDWFGQTSQNDNHWYAEFLIPWDAVPMKVVEGETRDIALYIEHKDVKANKRFSHASIASEQPTFISQFDAFAIKNFETQSFDLFASSTYQRDMLLDEDETNLSLDIFWRPDASQQLSVTINPDFGQVEADNVVVNFSPFETLFSERRAFFTQNQGLFDVRGNNSLRLVHTRRLGAEGDIDAALKYTKNSDSTDVGVIAVVEEENSNEADGNQFFVGRMLHRMNDTQLGYVFTYADKARLSRHSQLHALDIRSDLTDSLQLTGQLLGTKISNRHTSDEGIGASFQLSHKLSDNWQQNLDMAYYDDELQVNDIGFLPRNDLLSLKYSNEMRWNDFSDSDALLKRRVTGEIESKRNTDGEHLGTRFDIEGVEDYKNTAFLYWNMRYYTKATDDRITRRNGKVKLDDGFSFFSEYNWGNIGRYRHHAAITGYDRDDVGRGFEYHYHPSFYFTDDYRISWSLWATDVDDKLIWRDGSLNRYSYKEINNGIDFDATIANNQELRVRFEWVSYQAKNGLSTQYGQDGHLINSNNQVDDFHRSTTRFQVRYRYEIAPLSNIYLVYSRGGSSADIVDQGVWSTFNEGWDNRTADNFVAKIRYRF